MCVDSGGSALQEQTLQRCFILRNTTNAYGILEYSPSGCVAPSATGGRIRIFEAVGSSSSSSSSPTCAIAELPFAEGGLGSKVSILEFRP